MFSSRSSVDLSLNPLALARMRAHAASRPILDLTEANPTRAGFPYASQPILEALSLPGSLIYEPAAFGSPSARDTVAREISVAEAPVDPSRVVLTASTSEAYAFLFKLFCDPGDEVLVPVPSYPLFEHLARLESVHVVPYRLAYDGAWHVDLDSVNKAVTPRTRAIVTVSPNNPTGSYLKQSELEGLTRLGLPIVGDEVFSEYPLRDDATRVRSVLDAVSAPLVVTLSGLSKLAALPQMKLGWMVLGGEASLVAQSLERLEVIADAFLSLGTPVQTALPVLLSSRRTAAEAIRERTRKNLGYLQGQVMGSPVSVLDVEGGWYATLRLPRTRTELEWAVGLLEDDGVYVHPGHFFDLEEEAYLVVSLLPDETTFREGVTRIVERVIAAA